MVPDSDPPLIPPRTAMRETKGPALPEKPPRMRPSAGQREILVAMGSRKSAVDRRQREPAKLITEAPKKKDPHQVLPPDSFWESRRAPKVGQNPLWHESFRHRRNNLVPMVVQRSGSLSSDSDGEAIRPNKSALLASKRADHKKKNVTFNAFATVQLLGR